MLVEQLKLTRVMRPSDSLSIRNERERQLVKQLVAEYRTLPEEKRRQLPGLLNNLGKLELAAGDFGEAQHKFQTVATMESDPKLQAEAHYNAYQAALQRQEWAAALVSIQKASALDPGRFAPFPLDKYEPIRILGAGGFGVAFLCRHKLMKDNVVVKTLQTEELDCNVSRDNCRIIASCNSILRRSRAMRRSWMGSGMDSAVAEQHTGRTPRRKNIPAAR